METHPPKKETSLTEPEKPQKEKVILTEQIQNTIYRFTLVVMSVVFLASLWEFVLEDLIFIQLSEDHTHESISESLEYVFTAIIFTLLSLIIPFIMVLKDIKRRDILQDEKEQIIFELKQALAEVKRLQGFLPICSHCKNIRDEKGYWNQIEEYIAKHSEAEFSHSICEKCAEKHYPEYFTTKE